VTESGGDRKAVLAELEAEERSVSDRRRKLHERIAMFPDASGELERRERELSQQRRELHARIDNLREELRNAGSAPAGEPDAS
jgi:chromosome segregation ATPase